MSPVGLRGDPILSLGLWMSPVADKCDRSVLPRDACLSAARAFQWSLCMNNDGLPCMPFSNRGADTAGSIGLWEFGVWGPPRQGEVALVRPQGWLRSETRQHVSLLCLI